MTGQTDVYYIKVAGTSFRQKAVAAAKCGDPCDLIPQPDNQYDSNAILVVLVRTNHVLGYIPREHNAIFGEAIAAGFKLVASISFVGPTTSDPSVMWVQLRVLAVAPRGDCRSDTGATGK